MWYLRFSTARNVIAFISLQSHVTFLYFPRVVFFNAGFMKRLPQKGKGGTQRSTIVYH